LFDEIPPKYHYTVTDCLGHRNFIKNMITGSATADVGLLLVPANKGGFEAAIAKEGQTRQHALLLYSIGVKRLIVGINKMDSCEWSEARYNEIKDKMDSLLKKIGFPPIKVAFIPLSALSGDNLTTKSANLPWYKGWSVKDGPNAVTKTGFTLLEALDKIVVPPKRYPARPLLFVITKVYDSSSKLSIKAGEGNVIVCGHVYEGEIQRNDIIGAVCSGQHEGMVKQIENNKNAVNMASAGDDVGE
jgi:elongation factor 1-alpha